MNHKSKLSLLSQPKTVTKLLNNGQPTSIAVPCISHVESIKQCFQFAEEIAEGAYGTVWRTINKSTKEDTVLKKIKLKGQYLREVIHLLHLKDVIGVLPLRSAMFSGDRLWMEFGRAQMTLSDYYEDYLDKVKPEERLLNALVAIRQLFISLKDIHSKGIIHRDVKSTNVAVNIESVDKWFAQQPKPERGRKPIFPVKYLPRCWFIDLGMSSLKGEKPNSDETFYSVVTLPYRAPELMFDQQEADTMEHDKSEISSEAVKDWSDEDDSFESASYDSTILELPPDQSMFLKYDEKVDIWAMGVLLYEIITDSFPFGTRRSDVQDRIIEYVKARSAYTEEDHLNEYAIYDKKGSPFILHKKLYETLFDQKYDNSIEICIKKNTSLNLRRHSILESYKPPSARNLSNAEWTAYMIVSRVLWWCLEPSPEDRMSADQLLSLIPQELSKVLQGGLSIPPQHHNWVESMMFPVPFPPVYVAVAKSTSSRMINRPIQMVSEWENTYYSSSKNYQKEYKRTICMMYDMVQQNKQYYWKKNYIHAALSILKRALWCPFTFCSKYRPPLILLVSFHITLRYLDMTYFVDDSFVFAEKQLTQNIITKTQFKLFESCFIDLLCCLAHELHGHFVQYNDGINYTKPQFIKGEDELAQFKNRCTLAIKEPQTLFF
jgi:serine/threonine protein kinase